MSRAFTLAMLGLLALVGAALAQRGIPERSVEVVWRNGVPRLTFSARDLLNDAAREDIDGGLARRIRVIAQAFAEGRSDPIATRTFQCQIKYGVWLRRYLVSLGGREYEHESADQAIARCLDVRGLAIGTDANYTSIGGRRVFFVVRAEYRPMTTERCRQMLRSSASDGDVMSGLVLNIVRRQICRAERALEFRSAPAGGPR